MYRDLDTPVVLIDLNVLESNINEMSLFASEARLKLRPHIKVHGSAEIAKMQLAAGACGIEVGSIDLVEPLAENGISDILVAHPFYGDPKLGILRRLLSRPTLSLTLVVDMLEQAQEISQVGQELGVRVPVLIKVDTMDGRYGIPSGQPTVELAKSLYQIAGIQFKGIYTHEMGAEPNEEGVQKAAYETCKMMSETARMLRKEKLLFDHVSVGSSPTFKATCQYLKEGKFPEITEIHPGNRVIGDIMYAREYGNTLETCAVTVLTSVMSTTHDNWAIIDAGYKTFGAESIIGRRASQGFFWKGMANFGPIKGRPDLWFGGMSAEIGLIYYRDKNKRVSIGDQLEIIPNNATLVISMHKILFGIRNGVIVKTIPITLGPR